MHYWQTPEFRALKKDLGTRVAGVILANGCKTFAEFCEKFDTREMMRLPNFSGTSLEIVPLRAEATKDQRYPGWHQQIYRPGGFSCGM